MIVECTHGMPSPANCTQCMLDGPVGQPSPTPEQILVGPFFHLTARAHGRCARRYNHRIEPGDSIAYVPDLGWVCSECAP